MDDWLPVEDIEMSLIRTIMRDFRLEFFQVHNTMPGFKVILYNMFPFNHQQGNNSSLIPL